MSFFKKLFGKSEPFTPTPTQTVPGLDPIVVQAVETLYPDPDFQKQAFNFSLKFLEDKKGDTLQLLAALSSGIIDINAPELNNGKFWLDVMYPNFSTMNAAKNWLKSITKPQD